MRLAEICRYPVKSMGGGVVDRAAVEPQGLADDRRFMVVDRSGRFRTVREIPDMLLVSAVVTADGIRLEHALHGLLDVAFPGDDAPRQMVSVWASEVPARVCDDGTNAWLSRVLGAELRLVYLADATARAVNPDFGSRDDVVSFADGFPLLLTTMASLDDLNGRIAERAMDAGAAMQMRRFRPNVVVEGSSPWDEDTWRVVRIGAVRFRIAKPCERCVVTTRDPLTGERHADNEPLRTLSRFRRDGAGRMMFGQNMIPMERGVVQTGDEVEVVERGPSNVA